MSHIAGIMDKAAQITQWLGEKVDALVHPGEAARADNETKMAQQIASLSRQVKDLKEAQNPETSAVMPSQVVEAGKSRQIAIDSGGR